MPCIHRALLAACLIIAAVTTASCDSAGTNEPPADPDPAPGDDVLRIPLVVHVLHHGEPIGTGPNLSRERIEGQIRTLNDDFRRRPGTRGFNDHPDGGDARIEFVLASVSPDGSATDGIDRVNISGLENPFEGQGLFKFYAWYTYWNPADYLNVWTLPYDESMIDVVLGLATGPDTDLPGHERLVDGEPGQPEGVLINVWHFGESSLDSDYNLGRTLTHEIGHYLGLLHTWGGGDCDENDFCEDTPAVDGPVTGCPENPPPGCDGTPIMVENYMNWTADRCMNTFTRDQIERMHYVLENSPRRESLLESPASAYSDGGTP